MNKVSVMMAYWNRVSQFTKTIESYVYNYSDWSSNMEIVLVDDTPNDDVPKRILIDSGFEFQYIPVDRSSKQFRNPGTLYNLAASRSRGDILFLTNPENIHIGPVLKDTFDRFNSPSINIMSSYIVYGCRTLSHGQRVCSMSIPEIGAEIDMLTNWNEAYGWYQHSTIYNRLLHFGASIHKDLWNSIGGFDPIYDDGLGYEDNDLVEKILSIGIRPTCVDDPFVAHQAHDRSLHRADGHMVNQLLFEKKWGHSARMFNNENYWG